jgi:CubicO group peptidase (beta-lactamase class C family)
MYRRCFVLALILASVVAAVHSPSLSHADTSDDPAALNQFIESALQTYKVPGAAVAVVHNDQVVLQQGYGVRCLSGSDPVDPQTVFQLASDSKPFTAALLGTLVDQQSLDWDKPVTNYLPEFALSNSYATAYSTPRDLLAMRTGLPAFTGDLLGELGYSRDEALRRVRFIPLAHSLREEAGYSNIGYFAAGQVAARLTGKSWNDAVSDRLLGPLQMNRSGTSNQAIPADGNWACNHAEVQGAPQTVPWADSNTFGAAGGMVSTAADMSRWMRMLLNGGRLDGQQVLQPQTIQDMFTPSMVAAPSFTELPPIGDQTGFNYGMGWGVFYFHGHQVLEKGGALYGIRTITELVPDLKLGVTVLSNLHIAPLPEAVRADVLEHYLGAAAPDTQQQIQQAYAKILALFAPSVAPASAAPASAPLSAYAGSYTNPIYGVFTFTSDGTALHVAAGPGNYAGAVMHLSHDTFDLVWQDVTSGTQSGTFTLGPDGHATQFQTDAFGTFTRLESSATTP